ncbi:MAG: DoxX family protein [Flavobacteriaceae bacterium]
MLYNSIVLFVGCCFLFYGWQCLYSEEFKKEFLRFGLSNTQRKITGIFQWIGASGLLIGLLLSPVLVCISAGGLSLLMFLGFGVRRKIKDTWSESLPSLVFACINLAISIEAYIVS